MWLKEEQVRELMTYNEVEQELLQLRYLWSRISPYLPSNIEDIFIDGKFCVGGDGIKGISSTYDFYKEVFDKYEGKLPEDKTYGFQ